jgi:excisionase family DNA binding protein
VSDKTVRKWIKAGVLTAYQFQGEWRIRKADAVALAEQARFQV